LAALYLVPACSGDDGTPAQVAGRAGFFTFLLAEGEGKQPADGIYYYVPWSHTYFAAFGPEEPCGLFGFDFDGKVSSSNGTDAPTFDPAYPDDPDLVGTYDTNTFIQYIATGNGLPCQGSVADARLKYDSMAYNMVSTAIRRFSSPESIQIPSDAGADSYLTGSWTNEDNPAESGTFYFWPYEYAPPAPAKQVYLLGP